MTFREGEGFVINILRLLSQSHRIAEARILEPLPPVGLARRELALRAETAVRSAFDSEISDDGA